MVNLNLFTLLLSHNDQLKLTRIQMFNSYFSENMLRNLVPRSNTLLKYVQGQQFMTGIFHLHSSSLQSGTHDYEAVDVVLPANRHKDITQNKQILNKACLESGAVVRWKKDDGEMVLDEDPVLVVGRPFQIKAATDVLLSGSIENKDELEKYDKRLIWQGYKRNFKGQFPPENPRRTCIRCAGHRISGNPCPLCQMQLKSNYNVHFTDVQILEQFICPHTWEVLSHKVTGICRKQHRQIEAAVKKARDYGYLPLTLPLHSKETGKHTPAGVPTDKKIKVKMH